MVKNSAINDIALLVQMLNNTWRLLYYQATVMEFEKMHNTETKQIIYIMISVIIHEIICVCGKFGKK